jgi:hypothetical protein
MWNASHAYLKAASAVQHDIDLLGASVVGKEKWQQFKGGVKKVYENPIIQAVLLFVPGPEEIILGKLLLGLGKLGVGTKYLLAAMPLMVRLEHGLHDVYLMQNLAGDIAYVGRSMNWLERTATHIRNLIHGVDVVRGPVIARGLTYQQARALEDLLISANPHVLNGSYGIRYTHPDFQSLLRWANDYTVNKGIRVFY